jgi:hypothetical protein
MRNNCRDNRFWVHRCSLLWFWPQPLIQASQSDSSTLATRTVESLVKLSVALMLLVELQVSRLINIPSRHRVSAVRTSLSPATV